MAEWESWVRNEVKASWDKDSRVVRDHLELWLNELIRTLDPERGQGHIDSGNDVSQKAGLHRAILPGYDLAAVLKEYSLLRRAILMVLEREELLGAGDRETIAEAMDTSLSLAANEFTTYHRSQVVIALENAERSNRDLEQFAQIAAHDLKAPLATLTGYLEVMQDDIEAHCPGSVKLLDVARKQSGRLVTLIDHLMAFASLHSRQPEFTEVDLNSVADVAVENLGQTIVARQAVVKHERLPSVTGDLALLTQMFQNLIANAIKFNRARVPAVSIGCRRTRDCWALDFRDNGVGFDPVDAETMFQPYRRLSQHEFAGSGLGLATVRRVAELHRGRIFVKSTSPGGSAFTVELPF